MLVSVIIPTYNRSELLLQTIESVLNQTYKEIEIIIIDDNSDVDISIIVESFNDNRLICIRNNKNYGAPYSRNIGFEHSTGDLVAFLDDDDLWLPEKLEKQVERFVALDDTYGVVYCGFNYLVGNNEIEREDLYYDTSDIYERALYKCPVGSPSSLIRRSYFYETGGYDVRLPSCQDWDLWIKLSKICKFSPIKESLAMYRIHGEQISNNIAKKIIGRESILKKYYHEILLYPKIASWHYQRLGALYALIGDKKSKSYIIESLKYDKFNYGSWAHFILNHVNNRLHEKVIRKYGIKKIKGIEIID